MPFSVPWMERGEGETGKAFRGFGCTALSPAHGHTLPISRRFFQQWPPARFARDPAGTGKAQTRRRWLTAQALLAWHLVENSDFLVAAFGAFFHLSLLLRERI